MRHYVRYSLFKLAAITGVASLLVAMAIAHTAGAVANDTKIFISADNTFYAYAKAGETVAASFVKTAQQEPLNLEKQDITVTLNGPGIEPKTCVLAKAVAVGKGCDLGATTAAETGIHRITFSLPAGSQSYPEVSPTVKWGGNLFTWDVTVKDGTTVKQGRVWSELYAARQPGQESFVTNLTYHYVSEDGYIYRTAYKGYNGQLSTFSADAVGVRAGANCASAYASIDVTDEKRSPSFGECGGSYKVFFEQPAGDLPSSAKQWDSKTGWVVPAVIPPKVSDLKFDSDKSSDAQSGKISFKLHNFVGQYTVEIDTTGDGGYSSKEDVKIKQTLKKKTDATQTVTFDGVDARGQVVAPNQQIFIRINVEKVAEIHLVNADVEGRAGGLELVRLNGENAPSARMCWNDTDLATRSVISLQTETLDGRECPDSTDANVHGWPLATGSWGDSRYIDDWAYASTSIEGVSSIQYPETNEPVLAKNMRNNRQVLITIGAVVLLLVFVALVLAFVIKRRRHAALVRKATQQHQPIDFPGPGDPRPPEL